MPRRNTLIFIAVSIIFVLALLVVFPIENGTLGKKGVRLGLDLQGGIHIVYQADLSKVAPGDASSALDGAVEILQNRVNPLGVTEPIIQKQGSDRILLELPGRTITDQEKESLSRVDILEFGELVTENETFKWENELGKWKPATAVVDNETKVLTSGYFKSNTLVDRNATTGGIILRFEWNEEGSKLSEAITSRLIGQPLAIFDGPEALLGEDGIPIAPIVQSTIVDSGVIEGLSLNEATRLSKQLNFGRLPVPLEVVYEQTVTPVLGATFVTMSVKAGLIGVAMVMLFIILYYHIPGFLASLALMLYGVLNIAVFKLVPVTLTLAGLAGFIVSFGMAVDANVLIFERMKEELIAGQTLGAAIEAGFKHAWSAIWDSNLTTIIACIILIWLGGIFSPAVKGFGWTLLIGVVISMITAILVTRTLLRLFVNGPLAQRTRLFSPHLGGK